MDNNTFASCGDGCNGCEGCTDYGGAECAPAEEGKFGHLAGRGMHELRFDELPDYVASIAWNPVAQREAVSWIVSEWEGLKNVSGALANQLSDLRESDAAQKVKIAELQKAVSHLAGLVDALPESSQGD